MHCIFVHLFGLPVFAGLDWVIVNFFGESSVFLELAKLEAPAPTLRALDLTEVRLVLFRLTLVLLLLSLEC